jgi:hypothetical protein
LVAQYFWEFIQPCVQWMLGSLYLGQRQSELEAEQSPFIPNSKIHEMLHHNFYVLRYKDHFIFILLLQLHRSSLLFVKYPRFICHLGLFQWTFVFTFVHSLDINLYLLVVLMLLFKENIFIVFLIHSLWILSTVHYSAKVQEWSCLCNAFVIVLLLFLF